MFVKQFEHKTVFSMNKCLCIKILRSYFFDQFLLRVTYVVINLFLKFLQKNKIINGVIIIIIIIIIINIIIV